MGSLSGPQEIVRDATGSWRSVCATMAVCPRRGAVPRAPAPRSLRRGSALGAMALGWDGPSEYRVQAATEGAVRPPPERWGAPQRSLSRAAEAGHSGPRVAARAGWPLEAAPGITPSDSRCIPAAPRPHEGRRFLCGAAHSGEPARGYRSPARKHGLSGYALWRETRFHVSIPEIGVHP